MPTLYSGGAKGSDALFDKMAATAGHDRVHWSFYGHAVSSNLARDSNVRRLTRDELAESDWKVSKAGDILGRKLSPVGQGRNLIRRNYWQVRGSSAVFAVSSLNEDEVLVGGTAWAVQMACFDPKLVRHTFVYDQGGAGRWMVPDMFNGWRAVEQGERIPRPGEFAVYTGIGTRHLNELGEAAIRWLYEERT